MIRKIGFTLAEVLITLGIIGVVAEMTIPTLMNNVADQQTKVGMKKNFSALSQATNNIINDNGGSMIAACADGASDCLRDLYDPYLKMIKKCDNGTAGCFWSTATEMKNMNGTYISWGADSSAILPDGTLVNFWQMKSDCTQSYGRPDNCAVIWLDVNGYKTPNTAGKDLFVFHITPKGLVAAGGAEDLGGNFDCVTNPPSGKGWGCAYTYLYGN